MFESVSSAVFQYITAAGGIVGLLFLVAGARHRYLERKYLRRIMESVERQEKLYRRKYARRRL